MQDLDNKLRDLSSHRLESSRVAWIILTALAFHLTLLGTAFGDFRKVVVVSEFQNPPQWDGNYNPGKIALEALLHEVQMQGTFIPIVDSRADQDSQPDDPSSGSEESETQKKESKPLPAHYRLEGELTRIEPNVRMYQGLGDIEGVVSNLAELHLTFRLVHNLTQRVMVEHEIWAVGEGPVTRYPTTERSLIPGQGDFQETSMGHAFEVLARKTLYALDFALQRLPVDAQVLFVDEPGEKLILNAGDKHGIQIGDEFIVYQVNYNFEDPITGADLGDNFERQGVVGIIRVGEGFSEGLILAGEGFKQGQVARSRLDPDTWKPARTLDPWYKRLQVQPDRAISGRAGLDSPDAGLFGMNFFDLFGFSLKY